ncbi:MAG TPA: hypothetical protein VMW72_20760 [Sedimentisphaerales bacterium]|nr:hypothetical protein [Sedimentisphaerales bacterium]
MNQFTSNRKCVVFCLLSLALTTVTAFSETETEAPKPTGMGVEASRAIAAAKDRRAEEAYEKRNSEITPWVEDGTPPKQGNAALLYYQAFLLRPEPPEAIKYKIHSVTEPIKQFRTYLGHCLPMIEIVEIASRMPCIWGVWPERRLSMEALRKGLGPIQDILLMDARALAADGHYRVALERCLTLRRIAKHLSEDPELYIYSTGFDMLPLNVVGDVLSVMPPDAETLTWFRGQFAVVPGPRLSYAEMLQARIRRFLNHMRTTPKSLRYYKNLAIKEAEGEQAKENVRNLTDEQFLARAGEGFARFLDSIFRVLDSEMTYEQKLVQMNGLYNEKMKGDNTDPVDKSVITMFPGVSGYSYLVEHSAYVNGVKAAVEVYLVLAKTGHLPRKLPDHLPKDPYTDRDFIYEIKDEGFALRCQGKKFQGWSKRRLEFKVKSKDKSRFGPDN